MSAPSLLITQCLQHDMVAPIGRFDPIPNRLHVGYSEALRLMGERPDEGPVARLMHWAYGQPEEALRVVHLRDWHDPGEPAQRGHLDHFGEHCIRDTPGAAFAFPEPDTARRIEVVDSLALNDFAGTELHTLLAPFAGHPLRVGLVGVWTEAKISFLAYELRTRYPQWQVAVCSALTASSSRAHHFAALDRLERLLEVRVIDSFGRFLAFLGGSDEAPLRGLADRHPTLVHDDDIVLSEADRTLVRYLFRDCREVQLQVLGGGFSGNVVCSTRSVDMHGQLQVPHVLKVGAQEAMGKERAAFERVQHVLGNNAPQISDFVDHAERGAIKYRYASMGGGVSTTLQRAYQAGAPLERVLSVLDTVFGEQLQRFYQAATLESFDLLEHYGFHPGIARYVRAAVQRILGVDPDDGTLEILPGLRVPSPVTFYAEILRRLPPGRRDEAWQAVVHGDLNGQNIVLDGHDNVWLIDFFHTRRAHVLMDLVKLENDLLYLFTPISTHEELREACKLTDALLEVEDLAAELAEASPSRLPQLERAWATLRRLRSFHVPLVKSDRDPLQLFVAQLRYAGHTLSFDEPTALQHRWALYSAARLAERLGRRLLAPTRLRVDFLQPRWPGEGRLGVTLLPGRRDMGRELDEDTAALRQQGVRWVLCLVPPAELERYGVPDLLQRLREAGMVTEHVPTVDQHACSVEEMRTALRFVRRGLEAGDGVLVHCVGGLGRSGMVVASYLRGLGMSADEAIAAVRVARGPRAVETAAQEDFVRSWPAETADRR